MAEHHTGRQQCLATNQSIRFGHGRQCGDSLGVAVSPELLEVGPQIADLLLVLDAGEDHLGAGDLGARVADVFLERVLAPGDAGVLVGLGVIVAINAARMAALEAVEHRADLVLGVRADGMARQAFLERVFTRRRILGRRNPGRSGKQRRDEHQYPRHDGSYQIPVQVRRKRGRSGDWMATSAGRVNGNSAPMFPAKPIPLAGVRAYIGVAAGDFFMSGSRTFAPDADVIARRDRIVADLRRIVPGEGVISTANEMKPYESDGLTA